MNIGEFKDYLRELLIKDAAVDSVDYYDVPRNETSLRDLALRGTDGVSLYLRVVRTAPPGGDQSGGGSVTKAESGVKVITGE